jgi:hypothetical protein
VRCPVFANFNLAFALQLRKKHGKTSVRVKKTHARVRIMDHSVDKKKKKHFPERTKQVENVEEGI